MAHQWQKITRFAILVGLCLSAHPSAVAADNVLKIGVLNDQSGPFAAFGGKGAVLAAEMAIADVGGTVAGRKLDLVNADHQNKLDLGKSIATRWFDQEGVDIILDIPNSGIALAVQEIARERKKTLIINSSASTAITGKSCSPYTIHWADDTYAVSNSTATAVIKAGANDWYFITADYAFGRSMEDETTKVVLSNGGKVVGDIKHPLDLPDFSNVLIRAQSSNAKAVALASAGTDTVQAIRQAAEFGLADNGQTLVGLLVFISDVHAATPALAKNLWVTEGFYWDQNDAARTFSKRFFDKTKTMPTKVQASVYASLRHYFKAVEAVKSIDAEAVNAKMRQMPVDYFGHPAKIRNDGRVLYDLSLYQVKSPDDVKYPWDYYKAVTAIPAAKAFKPEAGSGCSLPPTAP